jgi:hypothetical protein
VEEAKERLIYTGIGVTSLPLIYSLVFAFVSILVVQLLIRSVSHFLTDLGNVTGIMTDYTRAISWGLVIVAGAAILIRLREREFYREFGLGLLLLGTFNFPYYILILVHHPLGFNAPLLDILLSAVIGVYLVVRWRQIDAHEAAELAGIVIFSWLVMTKGDFIAIIGGLVGLSSIVIVVFGVVYSLLADSALASGNGRWLPKNARLLLWVGYLVLSLAILNWITTTHGADFSGGTAARAFSDIGIPLAAWLVIRRPWTRREAELAALPVEEPETEIAPG